MQVGLSGFKVVLLGNSGSGKTSILNYALTGSPGALLQPTIGCNCNHHDFQTTTGDKITLNIWDTAGQELYRSIVPIYVRDAHAGILVYDVTDQKSFTGLEYWMGILDADSSDAIVLYVVCNKIDLVEGQPECDERARAYAEKIKAKFFRVSALKGTNIDTVFEQLATDIEIAAKREHGGKQVTPNPGPARSCKC
jgi:small GTP-binding protein